METYPFVSVIIPVFNDAARLKLCLAALDKQTYPHGQYEVVVVDNGSNHNQNVPGVVDAFHQANLVEELTPGSYAARNRGIAASKGAVIAFTDADCIPAPDWLEKGVHHLIANPACGMVAGRIEIFFDDHHSPTSFEIYQRVTAFPQEAHLKQFHGGATANVLTYRHVLQKVGNFDSRLKSFGDFEWGKRVFNAGYQQIYADDACVKHPARSSWPQLRKRTMRASGGAYDYFMGQQKTWLQRHKMFARLLFDDLVPPINFTISTFRNSEVQGIWRKFEVSLILLLVRYVSAWEKVRLRFGAVSRRE